MVAPVFGPFQEPTSDSLNEYSWKRRWVQTPPYNLPLQYWREWIGEPRTIVGDPLYVSSKLSVYVGTFSTAPLMRSGHPIATAMRNQALARLQDKMGPTGNWGENLGQAGKTWTSASGAVHNFNQLPGLALDTLITLVEFSRAVRRRQWDRAAQILRTAVPHGIANAKEFGSAWLAYSYGWRPLLDDLYGLLQLLSDPWPPTVVEASATHSEYFHFRSGGSPSDPGHARYSGFQGTRRVTAKVGCTIQVNNLNLYLAGRLGIANPGTVAWQLTPFSFVVDWFYNVEQFVSQGTDFLGLTVTLPWSLNYSRMSVLHGACNPGWPVGKTRNFRSCRGFLLERSTSLPGVTLQARPWKLPGWQRWANQTALLTQFLRGSAGVKW